MRRMFEVACGLALMAAAPAQGKGQERVVGAGQPALPTQTESEGEFRGDGCLGTSYYLRVGRSPQAAQEVERAVLAEIERLRLVFDWRDADAEFARLRPGATTAVSTALGSVLQEAERMRELTHGAFDPAVAHLAALWNAAETDGRPPSDDALAHAAAALSSRRWDVAPEAVRATDVRWSLDGLAKGAVLDRAVARAVAAGARDVLLDIGGDIVVRGRPVELAISDPTVGADNGVPLDRIRLMDGAVATSANTRRGWNVAGTAIGHVLDPRTGQPASSLLQATVVAHTGIEADALSTALLVLGEEDGLGLIESLDGIEALVVRLDGEAARTAGWPTIQPPRVLPTAWGKRKEVTLAFELARPAPGKSSRRGRRKRAGAYRRPYVAAWIETPDGDAVRTLCLWMGRERWLRDLRLWSRLHKDRRVLIDRVSRPTRSPGTYEVVFDGLDDAGVAQPLGEYVLRLEAAREHGTYQAYRVPFDTRGEAFELRLDPNAEFAAASVRFGKQGAEADPKPGEGDEGASAPVSGRGSAAFAPMERSEASGAR